MLAAFYSGGAKLGYSAVKGLLARTLSDRRGHTVVHSWSSLLWKISRSLRGRSTHGWARTQVAEGELVQERPTVSRARECSLQPPQGMMCAISPRSLSRSRTRSWDDHEAIGHHRCWGVRCLNICLAIRLG